jgi:hypothetical protein
MSAGYQYDVSGLFGAAPPTHPSYDKDGTITGVPVDLFNRKLQVTHCVAQGNTGTFGEEGNAGTFGEVAARMHTRPVRLQASALGIDAI